MFLNSTLPSRSRFEVLDPNVVVLERTHKVHPSKKVLLAANFGSMSEEKDFPEAYGHVRAVLTTPGPTRTRVRSKGFTISPGAAFIAEVTLQHSSSPVPRRDWWNPGSKDASFVQSRNAQDVMFVKTDGIIRLQESTIVFDETVF